jgi:hypothetical protein
VTWLPIWVSACGYQYTAEVLGLPLNLLIVLLTISSAFCTSSSSWVQSDGSANTFLSCRPSVTSGAMLIHNTDVKTQDLTYLEEVHPKENRSDHDSFCQMHKFWKVMTMVLLSGSYKIKKKTPKNRPNLIFIAMTIHCRPLASPLTCPIGKVIRP